MDVIASDKTDNTKDFVLQYSNNDFVYSTCSEHGQVLRSAFDSLLLEKWKVAKEADLFNYQVDDVETKILPGRFEFVAQMNANRKTMRRKPQNMLHILQPFDPEKFNFTKIKPEEILANLCYEHISPQRPESGEKVGRDTRNLEASLIINNAPICCSHSLVVPFLAHCQPQVLEHKGLLMALHTLLLSQTPDLRIAYNSLGGYASVNHLHFHLYYLPYKLLIETAECERLAGPCYVFKDYHAPGFVFQLENGDIDRLIRSVMIVIKLFLEEEMAHNMYITRGTSLEGSSHSGRYNTIRVVLWARKLCYGIKDISVFAAAACELAGHLPIYSSDHWCSLSEEDITPTTRIVCEESFATIVPKIVKLFGEINNTSAGVALNVVDSGS
ncbi:GDP-D-glucose phosphorylase 1-like isoform X1 [Homarus americanus]|uniref:GDP-D-glucose phosphorylase 1-like isoform X1 n=1 Tax=Homarus americanus TaxID=6706 RepID=UPI001C4587BA|nr:GDP-D-glucose phosphorylase 1-like isoform X1 [Homarus americanus]